MSDTDVDDEDQLPLDQEDDTGSHRSDGSPKQEETPLTADDLISSYYSSPECTIHGSILVFDHSYGYDCRRNYNLIAADYKTLVFGSGNYLHFFDVATKALWFRRCSTGGGIGHIAKNPNEDYPHIAVAENGDDPPIIIYNWPNMELVTLLKEGAAKSYSHINYSPDGELLVSQSGEPDLLITVWTWKTSQILLRTESHVYDVYRVMFSPYCKGHITTAGHAHIKFWKMVNTFTGLKLLGDLGRYGKTEFSDIVGVLPMPDEKVVSGCFWGNILIWEAGLIKLEVSRPQKKRLHDAPIIQFELIKSNQLWTFGQDGFVNVWDYDIIDNADPPDEDRFCMLDPLWEIENRGLMYMCAIKCYPQEYSRLYYAQDGNGGIWIVNLEYEHYEREAIPANQIFRCHAGAVVDIVASPWSHHFATLGEDGRIYFYDYLRREIVHIHEFPAKGSCLIWLPLSVVPSGDLLFAGYDDGVVRVIHIELEPRKCPVPISNLIQSVKAHAQPITAMSVNPLGQVLVTGSVEATIFLFKLEKPEGEFLTLVPIGYVNMDAPVTCLSWKHDHPLTILVGCKFGHFAQMQVPIEPVEYTTITYVLYNKPLKNRFTTVKAMIRREIKLREIELRKEAKRQRKMKEMEKYIRDNPGIRIDESYLEDSESEEELEPLYIPPIPNDILWIQSLPKDIICLSMSGYDAGYLYEYRIKQESPEPLRSTMVYAADDIMIYSRRYDRTRQFLIFGMENGAIRINRVRPDFTDLEDYWELTMHDNLNGRIGNMCFSYDDKFFFSCGYDGNVFSYSLNREFDEEEFIPPIRFVSQDPVRPIADSEDYHTLSLEEEIVKREQDRINALANCHKMEYWESIAKLRIQFRDLLIRNEALLPTQILSAKQLIIDPRITADLNQKLADNLSLVKRKLSYQVEKSAVGVRKLLEHFFYTLDVFPITVRAIVRDCAITTFRQRKLDEDFYTMQALVEQKILEAERKGRPPERPPAVAEKKQIQRKIREGLEPFLLGLSPSVIQFKLGVKINRLLSKYRSRRSIMEDRRVMREEMLARMPAAGVNHPDDEAALKVAKITIGDYKLKTAHDYKVSREQRETTIKKYKILLETRLIEYNTRHKYNETVYKMRDRKQDLRRYLNKMNNHLVEVQNELDPTERQFGPVIPEFDIEEFPERNLEIVEKHPHGRQEEPPAPAQEYDKISEYSVFFNPVHRFRLRNHDLLEKYVLPEIKAPYNLDKESRTSIGGSIYSSQAAADITFSETIKVLRENTAIQKGPTFFELEIANARRNRKRYEQEDIIRKMTKAISNYDNLLSDMLHERSEINVNCLFLELHVLTVHQELLVLQVFEAKEDELNEKVNDKLREIMDAEDEVTTVNNSIEDYKAKIEQLQGGEKEIGQEFLALISESKFQDFLKKIYKKKYRPPKIRDPDDESTSSSESSSSSSSSSDDASLDSRDFGIIKLDESICPKGCDPNVYNMTFTLRGRRHAVELEIKEQYKQIDNCKKEIENLGKKIKVIQSNLEKSQEELDAYMREKQKQLNEIMCCIILKLSQMQHLINNDEDTAKFSDVLVFSHSALRKLYHRVDELKDETIAQKSKHKLAIRHLQRMRRDIEYMKGTIAGLKKEIHDCMIRKFGGVVDLDELEEAVLRKLIYDLRLSMIDIRSMYQQEIVFNKNLLEKKQIELINVIKDCTARFDLLSLLNEEKADLLKLLQKQEKKRATIEEDYKKSTKSADDLAKLEEITREQKYTIEDLKAEIKMLKTKGLPPRPPMEPYKKKLEPLGGRLSSEQLAEDFYDEKIIDFFESRSIYGEDEYCPEEEVAMQISENAEEIVKTLLYSMMDQLDTDLDKGTVASLMDLILSRMSTVSAKVAVDDVMDDLLASLPYGDITEDQRSIVNAIAQEICSIQQPALAGEELLSCAQDILKEIIANSVGEEWMESPETVLRNILADIIQQLPIDFSVSDFAVDQVAAALSSANVSLEDLKSVMRNSGSFDQPEEIKLIINAIIDKIFPEDRMSEKGDG